MTEISLDEGRIKELMKQAMLELLKERRDLIYDVFAEVIEDLALTNAIKEGESTESVKREEVFKTLEGVSCKSISREVSSEI
jgi:vacuolar-type H+-ATPase subunit D/Vma8